MILKTQSSTASTASTGSSDAENTAPVIKQQQKQQSPNNMNNKKPTTTKKKKTKKKPKKEDLWKDALVKKIGNKNGDCRVEMCGLNSKDHTVYTRVVGNFTEDDISVAQVLKVMVDEEWDQLIHKILEEHQTVEKDSYPSATGLLELGAVWLLNETLYMSGGGAAAQRLSTKSADLVPDWKDFTLRVHAVPKRYFVAHEYDWTKYCRGRLVGGTIAISIDGVTPTVPVSGMPDSKDGVIVYDDPKLGFAVLCKPAPMPGHATLDNHAEDCCSMFQTALNNTRHISLPPRLDGEYLDTHGLLLVSTQKQFLHYMEHSHLDSLAGYNKTGVVKKYRCLVCVKDPDKMDVLESYVQKGTILTHYYNHHSKQYKKFKPKHENRDKWHAVKMKITAIGGDNFNLRAACVVTSPYNNSTKDSEANNNNNPDHTLARRLWGIASDTPAQDLGVQYVMQIEVEPLTGRLHQIRCQLAEMGFPIVGDAERGGGICETAGHQQHKWTRMALQCCELQFYEPERFVLTKPSRSSCTTSSSSSSSDTSDTKKTTKPTMSKSFVPSKKRCSFRLLDAWWTEFLYNYEQGI